MAKTTKQLSGASKDKALRALVESVVGLPAEAAARVGETLSAGITDVRVRREVWEAQKRAPVAEASRPATAPVVVAAPQSVAPAETNAAFDAYAFSAVSVLTRKGKAALAAALEAIASADHLQQLAVAQHLALDPALTDPAAIRAALVASTERRIAERKAAAS